MLKWMCPTQTSLGTLYFQINQERKKKRKEWTRVEPAHFKPLKYFYFNWESIFTFVNISTLDYIV
jgi:polyferredoxin